ncbi:hypothetical protein [Nocardia aurea]|uniref:PPE domain-containing protein n=1 Tax=Nocardia aurea TaxID=2144174 RepID=A0ABV3FXF4_9NOCA
MGLPFMVAIAAVLMEQGKNGPPDRSQDESPEAQIARNRIQDIANGIDVQYQGSKVPAAAFEDPDRMNDLYQRVQAMDVESVVNLHSRWESIRNRLDDGMKGFAPAILKASDGKWEGAACAAAVRGVEDYVDKSNGLLGSIQLMAEKVKILRSGMEITKPNVQEAPEHTWSSDIAGWVPGSTWKLNQHRDDGYHEAAVNVVRNVFYPAVREADTQVPLVPAPYNPIHDSSDQPTSARPTSAQQPSPGTGGRAAEDTPADGAKAGEGTPNSSTPSNGEQQSAGDRMATDPSGTTPASTNPASAAPTSSTDQNPMRTGDGARGNSASPGPGIPGTPAGSGSPNNAGPGRGVSGTPGVAGTTSSANNGGRSGAGRSGTAGTPGMGGMSPRGKGEDDKERRTKDYLVNQQHGEELTGLDEASRARTVPPVIGE